MIKFGKLVAAAGMGRAIAVSTIAVVCGVMPASLSAETLGDALAAAYKHSGVLEQNRALLRVQDEDVASSLSNMMPSLSYTLSSTPFSTANAETWTKTLSFVASMDLYTFGQNELSVAAAKETVLATRESLVGVEQTVLQDTVTAYMNVREALALINLQQSNVRLQTQNLRASRDRLDVGEVTRTDVSQFEASLGAARASLASAQGTLASARETYKELVGFYPGNLVAPDPAPLPVKSDAEARAFALRNHPSIKEVQHQVAAYDLAVQIAQRSRYPTLSATTTVASDLEGATGASAGLTLDGTIYSGGELSSAIRKAKANEEAGRANLLSTSRSVEAEVGSQWALLSVYRAQVEANAQLIRASRVAYEGIREEAALGASTTLDVLDAEQTLLDAQVSAIQAQIDSDQASYDLLAAMGLLTASHLKLGVPTYDPTGYYNAVSNAPLTTKISPQGQKLDRVLKAIGQ
ncbi:Outer membrane efflux protein BepC precursor [Aquimixticola soesokkakensis]|uniref:Outer membrane efflux protein BepC n=1 Tax=Aquimixticola soesokkakensis TaxID=1519096 RepID=A0A1Y5SE12_9RHOB|nr:TolC family protein [Aquimixticola soesokkakensis]SLN37853.1 Outer membrane efflux protein BepC precursor [Aquimixticola soesokkakensis]